MISGRAKQIVTHQVFQREPTTTSIYEVRIHNALAFHEVREAVERNEGA